MLGRRQRCSEKLNALSHLSHLSEFKLLREEQLAAQERSPKAKQQAGAHGHLLLLKVMKTMGLSDEEYARCKGSLAAQAALLLQRREQAASAVS